MADKVTPTKNQSPIENNSLENLEEPDSQIVINNETQPMINGAPKVTLQQTEAPDQPGEKHKWLEKFRQRINIYLLLFGLVLVLAATIILIAFLQSRHASSNNKIQAQSLGQSTLDQLANSDATVGSSQSILNVQSSAIFAGQVLVRQNLEVAGNIQIGGTVALSNITVAGASQLGQTTVNKNLAVAGDTAIQGAITIAKSLQVSGNGTFSGPLSAPQLTTSSLQLNGDLILTRHINVGGGTPSRNGGPALGNGGSASISGSDTSGSISINTGSNPATGCFVSVNFVVPFKSTPHVLVTPIGNSAGGMSYYVNRSTTSFSLCDAQTPPSGSAFGFDYFVVD